MIKGLLIATVLMFTIGYVFAELVGSKACIRAAIESLEQSDQRSCK